jgi:hypothetical protein
MRTLLLTGAAALSLAAVPFVAAAQQASASAQTSTEAHAANHTLTAEQQAAFDAWAADRQAIYVAWPPAYQGYYWTLTPSQQEAYFLLSAEQRAQIDAMNAQQRTLAWQSIERQVAGAPTANEANAAVKPVTETTVATLPTPSGPQQVITTTTSNAVPPPASALNKEYPVCRGAVQDSCINPREAGLNYGNRPLDHWPGEPASEIDTGG